MTAKHTRHIINTMAKTVQELQALMVDQLKRRGYYPKDQNEVLLRLGEELGELFEAVREQQSETELSHEVVDVLWNILRFCELKNIDLEKAFLEKLEKNESRPLENVTNVSSNA